MKMVDILDVAIEPLLARELFCIFVTGGDSMRRIDCLGRGHLWRDLCLMEG